MVPRNHGTGAGQPLVLLDDYLPNARFRTQHRLEISASPAAVAAAFEALTLRELRLASVLFAIRLLPGRAMDTVLRRRRPLPAQAATAREFFLAAGFVELRTMASGGSVLGFVGQPWRLDTATAVRRDVAADNFVAFAEPGFVKGVTGVVVQPVPGTHARCLLVTETRVVATDAAAERRFRPYWTLIEPFSGLIRVNLLRAVRRRAVREQRARAHVLHRP